MRKSAHAFLRGSFYRWVELWPRQCADLAAAPRLLGIGDMHVDNFGTWRDGDGRLAWGINDFDEAAEIPYTNDLVRLATSALLADESSSGGIRARQVCDAILEGYGECLKRGGEPIVMAERHDWLQNLASEQLKTGSEYWAALSCLQTSRRVDPRVRKFLREAMPAGASDLRIVHRLGGLGSLGRPRFTALAMWHGGFVAREAKALTLSTWYWRNPINAASTVRRNRYQEILQRSIRAQDPSLHVRNGWVVRRLAHDSHRIDLSNVSRRRDVHRLMQTMGWEIANVHLGSTQREAVLRDLRKRKGPWLSDAAKHMAHAMMVDWKEWKRARDS